MEALKRWWQSRTERDRRALMLLAVVVPLIMFWYLITRPLQDRLLLARRVLDTSRTQAEDFKKRLQNYAELRARAAGLELSASPQVITLLEETFKNLPDNAEKPLLNRTNITIFGKRQPAAQILLDNVHPQSFWQTMQMLALKRVNLAEIELTSAAGKNRISAQMKAWMPVP
ncbi:MAG: hypothetical protein EOM80_15375 [Erysipelotrichia bacterium]|nr:hypothetical protein [Erysipelotrichia bacterium]